MKKLLATLTLSTALIGTTALPAFAHGDNNDKYAQENQNNYEGDNNGSIDYNDDSVTMSNHSKIKFDDIHSHWARSAILDLVKKGVLNGEGYNKFDPDGKVTRAQFAKMVSTYFHLKYSGNSQDFNDVSTNSWEYSYVEASKDYFDKYIDLNGGYDFRPELGDTRQDVTVTLVKILMKLNPSVQLMSADQAEQYLKSQFKDTDDITASLKPYVATAVQLHLIKGDDNGSFKPMRVLSRGEAATLLQRLETNAIVVDGSQPVTAAPAVSNVSASVYNNTVTVTGTASNADSVTVAFDGGTAAQATLNASGAFTYTSPTLANGTHTYSVEAFKGSVSSSVYNSTIVVTNGNVQVPGPVAPSTSN